MPQIKEYKFKSTDCTVSEVFEKPLDISKRWTSFVYSVCLRSVAEIFRNTDNLVKSVVFNGWLNARNKSTGKMQDICILSLSVSREQFQDLEIENVDPVACFKSLKGVSAASLAAEIPIKPIQTVEHKDNRFIESRDVVDSIDEKTNLAAMDWQDFEHLIRELFEKEFCSEGSEVRITQSSRDGGVDAVIFDNDPIRGGKIVIQAKRYTNTVGVSAVRDLYGTILNEGAMKGILVTTSDYGPDSYDFAKDKPITLLNSGHLLWLLEKHGYHAKIDIEEARRLYSDQV